MNGFLSVIVCVLFLFFQNHDFITQQRKYPRVRTAISEKLEIITELFRQKNMKFPPENIFLRAFKDEQHIELWAQSAIADTFTHIKDYIFCSTSGKAGPKRMQGDLQIPEGFYYIDRFNPTSSFYLSLGLNYPNASDRILGKKGHLGGDIFIHGDCVTIGCIPITDEFIKELYVIAVYAKDKGQQKIPVHIFPLKLTDSDMTRLSSDNTKNWDFWNNLKSGYRYFEEHHRIPIISVDEKTGKYIVGQ
jgi:murein L,D-transpeptidase YafK